MSNVLPTVRSSIRRTFLLDISIADSVSVRGRDSDRKEKKTNRRPAPVAKARIDTSCISCGRNFAAQAEAKRLPPPRAGNPG